MMETTQGWEFFFQQGTKIELPRSLDRFFSLFVQLDKMRDRSEMNKSPQLSHNDYHIEKYNGDEMGIYLTLRNVI